MPPGSGVLAQAVQSYSILAPVNINASSYPAPYSKNKGPQRRRPVIPNFQWVRVSGKSVFKITVETAPTGRQHPSKVTLKHKSEPLSREGKTGNRG
jgi:hypothetical protein